jgi:hypothetical protein
VSTVDEWMRHRGLGGAEWQVYSGCELTGQTPVKRRPNAGQTSAKRWPNARRPPVKRLSNAGQTPAHLDDPSSPWSISTGYAPSAASSAEVRDASVVDQHLTSL